ncbi:hypothetical protein [Tannerella forsythia]|uniref:hypothetical protein n=1 Tax=Tannerella forsythia TaxID=28112 RepID=UPI000B0E6E3F|nr:hypothetical protein [Tannerella forsythia]
MRKHSFWVVISLLFLLVVFVYTIAVVFVSSSETVSREHAMDDIYIGGVRDIVFEDSENCIYLYINRGEEQYKMEEFRSLLLKKKAMYTYTRNKWAKAYPIQRIEYGNQLVYEFNR